MVGQTTGSGRLELTREELLAGHDFEEPLLGGGVLCHGGFIGGRYVSPRMKHRGPAIAAWQQRLRDEKRPLLNLPRDYVPPHYPSYEQAKYLLQERIVDPITRSLTIISIVEGFGARIRDLPLPDWRETFVEDVGGTAIAHLGNGLIEAHARDEAGHRREGGHKQMWEAARDLGLAKPELPGDILLRMMTRRGGRAAPQRRFPELPSAVENLVAFMAGVMIIEIVAEDVFEWAKKLLGDPEVCHDNLAAAGMVANIQQDEVAHVEYLRTALSEMRARTFLASDGKQLPGHVVVDSLFEAGLRGMVSDRPREDRERLRGDIHSAIEDRARASQVASRFEELDAGWTFPKGEDEKLDLLLETE